MTFWETIERGEYVMIALAVLLIAAIAIWWVRGAALHRGRKGYGMLMQRLRDHVAEGDLENARQLCAAGDTPGCRVLEAGVARIGRPMPDVKTAIDQVKSLEFEEMQRGTIWLRFIAVASPLIGLGGTLVGVIDRLRDFGEVSSGASQQLLSGQIAPTIVTTVAGLGVGVFALFALACLASSIGRSRQALENLSVEFTDFLDEPG